jgi:hypothetical protein|tara:strand:- start:24 stop:227 length:204 start_codon:yes stop_codon:yes gene_type:complete
MGAVKNWLWDQAEDFLSDIENKIKSGVLSVADAVEKCKNADIAFDLIGFNDIDEVEYYLKDVANEGK